MTDARNKNRIDVWPTTAAAIASANAGAKRVNRIDVWPTTAAAKAHTSGGSSYIAKAVHFDGSTYLGIGSLSTSDSPVLSFSMWLKTPVQLANNTIFVSDADNNFTPIFVQVGGDISSFSMQCYDPAGDGNLSASFGGFTIGSWHHFLFSCDVGLAGEGNKLNKLYVDGVEATITDTANTGGAFSNPMNGLSFQVMGDPFNENMVSDAADIWIAPGQSLLVGGDIPPATIAKFILAGKPVNLGVNGEVPTGITPTVFFSGDALSFATNGGIGGAFTLTGTLTNASTSPSD